jgi:two-component system, NarL family, sensor kinase
VYAPTLVVVSLVFVVFPDGRLPSRRWRPAVALMLLVIAGLGVLNMLIPRHLGGVELAPMNPTGSPGAEDRLDPYITSALVYMLLFMLATLLALRVRYKQAQAVERQQLKWFLYGAVALLVTVGP